MVTLQDIADNLNVNVSTVSRALKDSGSISVSMKNKVNKLAIEMGYFSKNNSSSPKIVGIIVPELISGYYAKIVQLSKKYFSEHGFSTLIELTNFDTNEMYEAIQTMIQIRASSLLIVLDDEEGISDSTINIINNSHLPVMLVATKFLPMVDVDSVYINETSGIINGINYLIDQGYQNIGFVGERMTENRQIIFRQVVEKHFVDKTRQFEAVGEERGALGGYLRMEELLALDKKPDAIFASYDQMAIGAIHAIKQKGLRIPEDIAVMGFDNIAETNYIEGGMTTIETPIEEMISVASNILLKRIESPERARQQVAIISKLIVRNTT